MNPKNHPTTISFKKKEREKTEALEKKNPSPTADGEEEGKKKEKLAEWSANSSHAGVYLPSASLGERRKEKKRKPLIPKILGILRKELGK